MRIDADDPKLTVVCKICRRQLSRYTCPTCNLPYCSLTCFRSPAHSGCSESFYKKELENGIKTQTSRNAEERLKMMAILKRFEEGSLENEAQLFASDDEDDDDLAARFKGIDVENTDAETLWSRLSEEEKSKFMQAINNPSSELTKRLLSESEFLSISYPKPWWEAPDVNDDADEGVGDVKGYGQQPGPLQLPVSMVKASPTGPPLIYNLCAICIAYAFTTRHLAASPLNTANNQDVKSLISRLVPFLVDRKATTLYTNISGVITSMWSHFSPDEISNNIMSALLHDASILMRPRPVSIIQSPAGGYLDISSHPYRNVALVLSDLHRVYGGTWRANHVSHKLLFYMSQIFSTPAAVLESLATDLEARAVAAKGQGESTSVSRLTWVDATRSENAGATPKTVTKLIEEI
ncbi:zinc finger hit domain-containing protein 2-like [Moniliophthora roreri MCA 2997]|uniref:Zinc finger hit domain-containing protein 2-like n=2 Tax=Moniliophthora roreri TaxID=221103 RepID=V2XVH1_MONRO|nr:zinc finger hit domain-containing protein 2-like [Moniliophthora roreri MCA 2997]